MHLLRRLALFTLLSSLATGCDDKSTTVSDDPPPVPNQIAAVDETEFAGVVATRSSEPVTVLVTDARDIPVEGVQVSFAVKEGKVEFDSGAVSTDADGVARNYFTYDTTAGESILHASSPNLDGSPVEFKAVAVSTHASLLKCISGDLQTAMAGHTLDEPVVVHVEDVYGNPVEGFPIVFDVSDGDGTVAPDSADTDSQGNVSIEWTVGPLVGSQTLTARGISVYGYPVEIVAEAIPDVPASIEIYSGDKQGAREGKQLEQDLCVQARDQYQNVVPGAIVGFAVTEGTGTLSVQSVVTDSNGIASTSLTLGSAGLHVVTATLASLPPVTFQAMSCTYVRINEPTPQLSSILLEWTQNNNDGFVSYSVYRSTTSGVTTDATLIATITDEALTSYEDPDVEIGTVYYYRLFINLAGGFSFSSNEWFVTAGLLVELDGTGFDIEYDAARERVYISVPEHDEIVVISTTSFSEVESHSVGTRPYGIDLSSDGEILYCALNTAGAIAALDLATGSTEEIDIHNELGAPQTYDVLEARPDTVIVTSSPDGYGYAFVVKVNIDFSGGHTTAGRIADGRIIRASPTIARSSDGWSIYVGEIFSPNSLYKIDLTDPAGPLVLEDDHGSVAGTTRLAVSPDDELIYLGSGQVLQTSSFVQIGYAGPGLPQLNGDGSICYMGNKDEISGYNTSTYTRFGSTELPYYVDRMILVEDEGYVIVLSANRIFAVQVPD